MSNNKLKQKVTLDDFYELQYEVLHTLKHNLDDPKMMASAVKFLKDNSIEITLTDSQNKNANIFATVEALVNKEKETDTYVSINELQALINKSNKDEEESF